MKKAYTISIFCALLFMFMTGSALADEEFGPGVFDDECATVLDPAKCCDRAATEAARVVTARSILQVHARTVGDPPTAEDDDHYHISINGWAVNGSGEDGIGIDGAVYKESTLSNFGRQDMWDYLDEIFAWSGDMELITGDEMYTTHPDGSMTYMVGNVWFGSTEAGYYEQPGFSIVKFRPGEGCAAYQRDYFSEGDTYWGMSFAQNSVRVNRQAIITGLGLTDKCVDDDGDGYTKYIAATGCTNAGLDCDDYHAEINPGATEIPGNGIDDDCNPATPDGSSPCAAPASVVDAQYRGGSDLAHFLLLFVPLGAVLLWSGVRRRR